MAKVGTGKAATTVLKLPPAAWTQRCAQPSVQSSASAVATTHAHGAADAISRLATKAIAFRLAMVSRAATSLAKRRSY